MVAHEAPAQSPEKQKKRPEIPKSREIFAGDINDAVITVQNITGFEITPEWWVAEVGNDGTTEEILDRFDTAFEQFVHLELGIDTETKTKTKTENLQEKVISEADKQLSEFDSTIPEIAEKHQLREEFIDALAEHLKEKYFPSPATGIAWSEYNGYDKDYQKRNEDRTNTGSLQVSHYAGGNVTAVASINIDPTSGEATNGHDHRPEATSHRDTEIAWQEYILATPEDERFVIFEGEPDNSETRDEAIIARSDSGLLQYLAHESQLDPESIVSGDPKVEYARAELEKQGFSPADIQLYELIRHLSHDPKKEVDDLNLELYGAAALVGVEGFPVLNQDEKTELLTKKHGIDDLRARAAVLAGTLNQQLKTFKLPEFIITTNGDIHYEQQAIEVLNQSWDPRSEGLLADIQRANLEIRDKYLFEQIATALEQGKKPFIVFGGSHISALQPALEHL